MKLNTVILVVFVLFSGGLFGQNCGVSAFDQMSWSRRYEQNLNSKSRIGKRALEQIPIVFHLITRQNGAGGASIKEALAVLCEINDDFKEAAISFYLAEEGIHFVKDDGIFTAPQLAENQLKMNAIKNFTAINVFVVNKINDNGDIGIYEQNEDWVLIQKGAFLSKNKTLAHEIGHYFSLYHPHFGWESSPWTSSQEGKQVGPIASDGMTETEHMNGVNCYLSGDKLCDTAPDYNFGVNWQKSCTFEGIALDPKGTRVDPDETLIMSFFNDSCRSNFTREQIGVMRADLASENRQFLFNQVIPEDLPLEGLPQLTAPNLMIRTNATDSIFFEWSKVENAKKYYLEVDLSPNFNLEPKGIIVGENHTNFSQNWLDGLKYYWRVFSWNEQNTCSQVSATSNFEVEILSSNVEEYLKNDFQFYQSNASIVMDYKVFKDRQLNFQLWTIGGRLVLSGGQRISSSKNQQTVFEGVFSPGIYVIKVFGDHNFSKKIILFD